MPHSGSILLVEYPFLVSSIIANIVPCGTVKLLI